MFKKIYTIVILVVFAPAICQAIVFTEDGAIDGGTYGNVTIENDATVDMTAGTVDAMSINQVGTLNFYGGTIIEEIYLRESGILNLEGANFHPTQSLTIEDASTFNLNSGVLSGRIELREYVEVYVNGGQITDSLLDSTGYAITDIYDGIHTFEDMWLYQYSTLNIYGGDVSWLTGSITDNAVLNVYGGTIDFEHGFSVGNNGEFNVHYSDIIYLNEWDEIITGYHLLDGSEFMLDQFTQYEIDQINFVPEPTTLLLFGLGGLLLRKRR